MLKTLIIDDNDYKIESIKQYLTALGISNITVRNSRNQGLVELSQQEEKNEPYELLVLDMMFPNYPNSQINQSAGYDVLREIKRKKWDISVILCSSDQVTETSEYSNILGVIHYDQSVCLTQNFKELVDKYKK